MKTPPQIPELLAPAGNYDCMQAAIENGADAVYFGLATGFNARARAANFDLKELHRCMELLHNANVKGYVTLNTLVFPEEIAQLETIIRTINDAGVDAVLIQDLGLIHMVHTICPDLPIHASTQMTMTSAETISPLLEMGVERVVVARELSISEIAKTNNLTEMPIEAFVHGALCVAYSGQCLTSESLGGRSANRGQCAQACRLPYEIVCDGEEIDLQDQKYLLSPQDLAAFELIPELIAAGVVSLKIEGRLKTPEYVANITKHYRKAIDQAISETLVSLSEEEVREMELSFSRGFSPGWLEGCDHKMLVPGLSSSKRGVSAGKAVQILSESVVVNSTIPLKAGDGIVFAGDRTRQAEQGGRIFEILQKGRRQKGEVPPGQIELRFLRNAVNFEQLTETLEFWKTDDQALTKSLRKSFQTKYPRRKVPIAVKVTATTGKAIRITASLPERPEVSIKSEHLLEAARKHTITAEQLEKQLGRLGNTRYHLASCHSRITGNPMVPLSVLGELRKRLIASLDQQMIKLPLRRSLKTNYLPELRTTQPTHQVTPRLSFLARSKAQLSLLNHLDIETVYCDFQDIREYADAIDIAKDAPYKLFLATPRIQKPGELGVFRTIAKHSPDGILVRNLSGIEYFRGEFPLTGDFSLNATNQMTVTVLKSLGLETITPSYDLNREQLETLVQHCQPQDLQIVIHQHMPMFHMEHCVFCSVLSPGTDKTNCGRPCDHHQVELRDRVGALHPLTADVGCRNTLFNAQAQSGAEIVPALIELGISSFRIELLKETRAEEVQTLHKQYQALLNGSQTGTEVWKSLRAMNRVGITRGTLEHDRDPLAIL